MKQKPKQMVSQSDLIKLSLIFARDKDIIQQQFDSGKLTSFKQLAEEKNATVGTVRKLCAEFGIVSQRIGARTKSKCSLNDVLTVLQRVCQQLDINHDEIKPYLYGEVQ